MSQFFGESERRARIAHTCDYCCEEIWPGDTYRRVLWKAGHSLHVMKEHTRPPCQHEIEESIPVEDTLGVTIAVTLEVAEVVRILVNGDPVTTQEIRPKLIIVDEALPPSDNLDDEIPF